MYKTLLLLGVFTLFIGCSDGNSTAQSSAHNASSTSATTPTTAETGLDKASATSSFTGEGVRLIGRFDTSEQGQVQFTWPGSTLEFSFEGTEASIAIASNGESRFQVDVDGAVTDVWVTPGEMTYILASDLPHGIHHLRLTRLTESFAVVTRFTSDPQVDGKLLPAPEPAQKRLLVIGDSITAGYGVEGSSHECSYSIKTSNQQLTYAALAANALDADLHAIAWSGIGAWRSYGEVTPVNPNILTRYQRTLADDSNSIWDTAAYQPDTILINIGTNDYWQGSVTDDYRLGMKALIERVQNDYPEKPIYLILSPMMSGAARDDQAQVFTSLAEENIRVLDLGKIEAEDGLGCDYHPNQVTQTRLGKALEAQLKSDLQW